MKIKYTDGGTLKHASGVSYTPGVGYNPNRDRKTGQFTFGHDYDRYGSNYRFGSDSGDGPTYSYKNRYQYTKTDSEGNTSTEYTQAGKRRQAYEESVNNAKKKENRLDEEAVNDVSRWIRDDSKNYLDIAKSIESGTKATNNVIDMFNKPKQGKRIDLSQMSDDELRAILNREQMERTYNSYFNPPTVNKGWEVVKNINDFALNSAQGFATVMSIISAFK